MTDLLSWGEKSQELVESEATSFWNKTTREGREQICKEGDPEICVGVAVCLLPNMKPKERNL